MFHANGNQKRARAAMLISHKIDFKSKTIIKDKEGHCIMIKGSIHQGGITSLNKFNNIEIIQNIFSDHYRMKLEINSRSKT